MKKFLVVGIPDEENIYSGYHTKREEKIVYANSHDEAVDKGFSIFPYFHEVYAQEVEEQ